MNTTSAGNGKSRGSRTITGKSASGVKVSDNTIMRLSHVFRLLADKHRLKILLALAHGGEMHVSALCTLLGQSQPAVSHHLSLMRARDLVGYRRAGKHNFYFVHSGLIRDLLEQFFADVGNGHKQLQFEEFILAYKRK